MPNLNYNFAVKSFIGIDKGDDNSLLLLSIFTTASTPTITGL